MCEQCPRAMAIVPTGCESTDQVSKPECKDYFCGVINACPDAPVQSPIPGMPQDKYVENLKLIKDGVGTCPAVEETPEADACSRYSLASFVFMASFVSLMVKVL